ncbi:MAG: glycosyltransferase [Tannerellaceae bacterium]|jgi:hypothetical protein|nr:glycosyltransferase [Tannerellaceae bacterium]
MMDSFAVFSTAEWILISICAALFIAELLYYRITYLRPYRKAQQNKQEKEEEQPPVSVIVYADNESHNLKENLPLLLNQDYPQYEVIVVNDGSTDESDEVLITFENEYPHLYHTFIPQESKYLSRRKLSLTIGIKAAHHDILLFTDARCRPLTNQWVAAMVSNYTAQIDLTLGFCAYRTQKGFFHKLVSYDNLLAGVRYLSAALCNRPYSGNGQNLSYRKSLFFEHKGYSRSLHLHAGADDLFVNESATGRNTGVAYTPDSFTERMPYYSMGDWIEMKASRIATHRHFRGNRPAFYHTETICSVLFLLSVVASIALGMLTGNLATALAGLLLYTILYIVKAIVWKKTAALLSQTSFTAWLPFLEIAYLATGFYIRTYRLFRRKRDYTFTIGGKN